MKNLLVFLFGSFLFIHTSLSQNTQDSITFFNISSFLPARSSERGIPFRTQSQIDSIQIVAQGYMVFNTTTGCLNYYFGKSWHQLCGECIPKPHIPKIDSVISKGSRIFVYFQKNKIDSLEAYLGKKRFVSYQSPLIIYVQEQLQNPALLILKGINNCGTKDTTLQINIEGSAVFSPIITEEIDGKKIRYRKYGNCKWMVDDYILDKPAIPNSPYWVSMENTKNPCPKGWIIPTEKDWLKLLENFEGNYAALLEKPTDENISLGLNQYGFYITQEKKVLGQGTASYWVGERKGNKHKLINITENGYLIPEEDPKLFMIPLRCIQCEK